MARNTAEYTAREQLFTEGALAVDVWINPEQLVTEHVTRLLSYPGALQVLEFADGRVALVGLRARRDGLLVGRELRTLREHLPDIDARVAAIYREDRLIPVGGDTVIAEDDEIFFVAAADDLKRVMAELRRSEQPVRRIVIAGGGNIGFRLARALEKGSQVKLIERDARRARRVSEMLENAIVLHGDAADEELLIEENIDSADVFAALTNSEESNVLAAMLAKRLGARRVMALVSRPAYAELTALGEIDVAISPQTVTIGSLLAHVRRGAVVRVHSLRRGAAEAMEAVVHGSEARARVAGRRVEEVALPDGASWSATGVGRSTLSVAFGALAAGGHLRVGMEDTLTFRRGEPVRDNAQLVERAAVLAELAQRPPMTSDEARELLRTRPLNSHHSRSIQRFSRPARPRRFRCSSVR